MTGLLVQPVVGALSDRTLSPRGRRTPYFLVGAVLCSLALLAMPFSPALWAAAGLLWILDAANNVTMEPYRAYVTDRLAPAQQAQGFLTQSAFTGLGQTLSYLTPSLLVGLGMSGDAVNARGIPHITTLAFLLGAVFSITSILWSVRTTPELPLTAAERARIAALPRGMGPALREIADAMRDMPATMRQLAVMKLFQWYAMFFYGASDPQSAGFREAGLVNGQLGGFYNFVAFLSALAMVPVTRRFGARWVHAAALTAAGVGMWMLPSIRERAWLFLPMVGVGLAWGSMMGNPYVLLANAIPAERVGVYMGIFNMFIVLPMMLQIFTLPLYYEAWLGGDPANVVRLAGVLLLLAAAATLRVRGETAAPG
jgi:maltose/moltooligosaccharide transporter